MKQPSIVIVDYGVGNIFSVNKALNKIGYNQVKVSRNKLDIKKADYLILPGVGAFNHCINNLKKYNLIDILNEMVLGNSKPILGICVGMQLMASFSEENGLHQGLGWIPGKVVKLKLSSNKAIPHVGWNNISIKRYKNLFENIQNPLHFYFDHSYQYLCKESYIVATCEYEINITSVINLKNIYGVQFHPEKSQKNGLKLFRSFLQY